MDFFDEWFVKRYQNEDYSLSNKGDSDLLMWYRVIMFSILQIYFIDTLFDSKSFSSIYKYFTNWGVHLTAASLVFSNYASRLPDHRVYIALAELFSVMAV